MATFKIKFILGLFLFAGTIEIACAQQTKPVFICDSEGNDLAEYRAKSLLECQNIAIKLQGKYQREGFISCSVDTIISSDSNYIIRFYTGMPYQIKSILIQDSLGLFTKVQKVKEKQLFTLKLYYRILNDIVQTCKNKGYPLTEIISHNVIDSGEVTLSFKIKPVLKFAFDSVDCNNNIIQNRTMEALIGINAGNIYNQKKVDEIESIIDNTGYLQFDSLHIAFGLDGKAKIKLDITGLKTNSVSGLIGVAPSANDKTSVTGEVFFNLQNVLKRGEILNLNWKKSGTGSQYLNLDCNYPYIKGKNLGIAGGIEIDKFDTTFFAAEWNVGLLTTLIRNSRLLINYSRFKSSRIDSTNNQFGEANNWQYGCLLKISKTNFRLNPSKGYVLKTFIRLGQRIEKQDKPKKSDITKLGFDGQLFFPISHFALVFDNHSAFILADTLYKNEMFRIGGEESLRGVVDRSVFASAYSVSGLEYRWLYEKFSNVYIFIDYAWISSNSSIKKTEERYAFGAGLHLNSKAGLISVSYAIGNSLNQGPNPSDGIIHIGLISRF